MVVPDQGRDQITSRVADSTVVEVSGTNHHTIFFSRLVGIACSKPAARTGSRTGATGGDTM